ncbi:hypothetical protein KCP74_06120 [Salmonella enterica subsp. enterica]|nr:hypothetical protein KCP74_06120 [Salmonella enterica subsp. enterica]
MAYRGRRYRGLRGAKQLIYRGEDSRHARKGPFCSSKASRMFVAVITPALLICRSAIYRGAGYAAHYQHTVVSPPA